MQTKNRFGTGTTAMEHSGELCLNGKASTNQCGRLVDGDETIFKVKMGPLRQKWVARHHSVVPGESFADGMIKGHSGHGIITMSSNQVLVR